MRLPIVSFPDWFGERDKQSGHSRRNFVAAVGMAWCNSNQIAETGNYDVINYLWPGNEPKVIQKSAEN